MNILSIFPDTWTCRIHFLKFPCQRKIASNK